MKMRVLFALAMLSLPGAMALGAPQPAPTVAVYDFKGQAEAAGYGGKVTTLVTADLAAQTNLVMLERSALNKALSEQAFGISGLVSSDAAARIGQITGAQVLVSGQVMTTGQNHLIIVATIIGTESGRLFAAKVEGAADNLLELTSDLSAKIAQSIASQATNLITAAAESSADRLDRIVNSISGTNRPSIQLNLFWPGGKSRRSSTAEGELGMILLKAGFPVVDSHSERKPEIEISGVIDFNDAPRHGEVFSTRAVIELKVQKRQTGQIIVVDRQESTAADATQMVAERSAQALAVDELAERILPLLAK